MKSAFAILLALPLLSASGLLHADESSFSRKSIFEAHCVKCHGRDGVVEGQVNLVRLSEGDDFEAHPEILEKLISVLEDRQMPPEDEPQLAAETRKQLISALQHELREALQNQAYGPTPIRRMNRFQYNNAVVDLLELDRDIFQLNERLMRRREDYFRPESGQMPDQVRVSCRPLSKDIDNERPEGFKGVAAFPQDQRAEHGFDNRADHISLSPLLMESFLHLSQTIAESRDLNPRECRSWDWLFAPPGKPARAPIAGRYEAEKGSQIRLAESPPGKAVQQNMNAFGTHWSGDGQLWWRCRKADTEMTLVFEVTEDGNELRLGLTKAPVYGTFELYLDDVQVGERVDLYDPGVVFVEHVLPDVAIGAGTHKLKVKCVGKREESTGYFFGIDYVEVKGQKVPTKTMPVVSDSVAIRARMKRLLRRAFRQPVDSATLTRFTDFAEQQLNDGVEFEQTMRTLVGTVLGMPDFLYFYETGDEPGLESATAGRQSLNDFELATRLAQFFWSSIPDDALLDLAEAGQLRDPATLSSQIDRMLNDRKSRRFCENFPAQWLQLDRLVTAIPDREKFDYFYYNGYRTSMHMMSEPLLLFETVYVEDRSIMELIDPGFTWQSEMLGANYEGHRKANIEVQVQQFRRVPLDDPRRGGVITNAAIMTMTSTPSRTQPITRGAWVNAVIFNDPPEPPPADVPPLPEVNSEELAKLTIRERLAVHRQRADCAGCHNRIDPLGFALENYGPTGIWRDNYENGREVDVSGVLFNQHPFESIVEFKQILLDQERDRFSRGFIAHLLSYALSRELGPADSPALDEMTAEAMAGDDRLRSVLKRIAMSEPFLSKSTVE